MKEFFLFLSRLFGGKKPVKHVHKQAEHCEHCEPKAEETKPLEVTPVADEHKSETAPVVQEEVEQPKAE
jgi:hypothetical protein